MPTEQKDLVSLFSKVLDWTREGELAYLDTALRLALRDPETTPELLIDWWMSTNLVRNRLEATADLVEALKRACYEKGTIPEDVLQDLAVPQKSSN